ncbi:hypothetical protein [Janthinobacterium sp. JC611]|uniref:hypothetical protein n=1 Tax=Janthinobacterium sp. JC611 TaxID=2816201 RepID=UPI001BFE2915|nr:hypothetical protein [Janthinobacterium sp. JC611]
MAASMENADNFTRAKCKVNNTRVKIDAFHGCRRWLQVDASVMAALPISWCCIILLALPSRPSADWIDEHVVAGAQHAEFDVLERGREADQLFAGIRLHAVLLSWPLSR